MAIPRQSSSYMRSIHSSDLENRESEQAGAAQSVPETMSNKEWMIGGDTGDRLAYSILQDCNPLSTDLDTAAELLQEEHQISFSRASTEVGDSPQEQAMSQSSSLQFPLRLPKSFLSHRMEGLSNQDLPHQSAPGRGTSAAILAHDTKAPTEFPSRLFNAAIDHDSVDRANVAAIQHLSTALPNINTSRTSQNTKFAPLRSPCFFHQRFDDAVNIDRVLEEIVEDDGMSHGRLMQTATSVREISKQLQRRPIKRAVRTVMIVTKARDNSLVHLTRELTEWLLSTPRNNSNLGVTVYVDAKLRTSKRFDAASLVASNPQYEHMLRYWTPDTCWSSPEKFDLVLTLGGDGTVLYTSCLFQRIVPPILAFSLGSLGFLTNFEYASYKTSLNRVLGETGMRVNLRMRFTCTVFRANLTRGRSGKNAPTDATDMIESEQFEVLNELVIDRGPSPYVSNLELYGDDELLTVVQADGCIFSTPTGSTAYSLSAGGPLTHPSIPGILLTPICPHTLSFRPMVLSDSLLLKVCIPKNSRSTAYASFDGKGRIELRRGDCVQVEAGRYPFPTVVGEGGTGGEWFESVRRALRWNTRGAVQKGFNAKTERFNVRGASADQDTIDRFSGLDKLDDRFEDGEDDEEGGEEEWDINPDPVEIHTAVDSGFGTSKESSSCTSPAKRSEVCK